MNYYLIGAMVGAGAGYALSKKDREKWALIGAGVGVAAGYVATRFEEPAAVEGEDLVPLEEGVPAFAVAAQGVAPAGGGEVAAQNYAGYSAQGYNAPAVTAAGGGAPQTTVPSKSTPGTRTMPGMTTRTGGTTGGASRTAGGGASFTGTGTSVRRTRIRRTTSDPGLWVKTR